MEGVGRRYSREDLGLSESTTEHPIKSGCKQIVCWVPKSPMWMAILRIAGERSQHLMASLQQYTSLRPRMKKVRLWGRGCRSAGTKAWIPVRWGYLCARRGTKPRARGGARCRVLFPGFGRKRWEGQGLCINKYDASGEGIGVSRCRSYGV